MPNLRSLIPFRPKAAGTDLVPHSHDLLEAPISAFESEVSAILLRTRLYSQHAFLHVIAGFLLLTIVLLSVIKLDIVVSSTGGQIATEDGPIYVQPLNQGIIHQIKVHVGDIVKKDQVLATLDPTFTTADETQLREHLASDQAMVDRLTAERDGKAYTPKSGTQFEELQLAQWQQRQEEYKNTIAGYNAQIKATQAQLGQAQRDVVNYTTRLKSNAEIESMRKEIEAKGWGSRLMTDQAVDARAEIERLLQDAQQETAQYSQNIDNLKAQLAVYLETWKDYIANNLVTTQNDLIQTQQALTKAAKLNELVTLTAPEDGVVVQVGSASVGSVVQPEQPNAISGQIQPLFTLTPLHDNTEALLEIDSDDVAFIRVGDRVTLKVDAFPYIRFNTAEGVVKAISQGSFTQEDNGTIRSPYFKVWVNVTQLNFRNVPPNARLIPGMTLTGDIKVGTRSVMSYLVEGLLRNATGAMREP